MDRDAPLAMRTKDHNFNQWALANFLPGTYWHWAVTEDVSFLMRVVDRQGSVVEYDILTPEGRRQHNRRIFDCDVTVPARVTPTDETEWLCAHLVR